MQTVRNNTLFPVHPVCIPKDVDHQIRDCRQQNFFSFLSNHHTWKLGRVPIAPGTPYFSKAAEAVDIAERLKTFPICVAALKSSVGFDKVGCTRAWE
jgi:hypothetical protein